MNHPMTRNTHRVVRIGLVRLEGVLGHVGSGLEIYVVKEDPKK